MRDVTRPPRGGQDPPARHLALVHPAPPPKPKKRHRTPPLFSPDDASRLRAALRGARVAFGSYARLASVMDVPTARLQRAGSGLRCLTADVAIRLARALGKPLESLYAAPSDASTCPTCGARRTL